MKCLILMGSPRKNGNTVSLLKPFMQTLNDDGAEYELIWLYDQTIHPCTACRACQTDWSRFGCQYNDSMQRISDKILSSDIIVLATPIYSWYCTPPMKAMLDRLVYGMNKYYGDRKGPALWAGKKLAMIVTCGYPTEKGTDLFETGMIRYCKHSQLTYTGILCERDLGYDHGFMNSDKTEHARAFAKKLLFE